MKNDSPVQSLANIAGRRVATTSGSIYDRWMKRCYTNTDVTVTDSFTNALLAFNQGRADALMWDDTVLVGVAAADPSAKLTNDTFLALPYGIGIKQGNVALKRWVDSRLELMRKKDHFMTILKQQRAGSLRGRLLEEHPPAGQHVRVRACGLHRARTPFASSERSHHHDDGERPRTRGRSAVVPMILATYDLWAFVSENREELLQALVNTLKVSAIAIAGAFVIGVVLGAARAHRIPVVSQFTAVYVEVIRNTPILVQIFMIFYALPQFGIVFDQFTVAWLSVMIWGGAFNSENFRAGFEAVPYRYREAARPSASAASRPS